MALSLDHLDLLDEPAGSPAGVPLSLPAADIDEDPAQPRQEFDDESLQQLADSIAQRGVLQAISVRPHPEQPDRWMLNFGARRLRASKLAGRTEIPAFVDEAADDYDQVIENEQREGLTPLELALFVKKRFAAGDTQAEIARRMGKSQALITMVRAMIDPPDWLMQVYRSGRCRGLTELYELRRLHERDPDRAAAIVAGEAAITRGTVLAAKLPPAVATHANRQRATEDRQDANRSALQGRHAGCAEHTLREHGERLCAQLDACLAALCREDSEGFEIIRQRFAALAQRYARAV